MDNFEKQLRQHFDSQQLPAARVQEILAAGRAAGQARRHRRVFWRVAAAAAVLLGLWAVRGVPSKTSEPPLIAAETVAKTVAAYFSQSDYTLSHVSADPNILVEWIRNHGGPQTFSVPATMAGLSSYGCQVLEIQGQKVHLICFVLEGDLPPVTDVAMPTKKMMTVTTSDGQMMKKKRTLVHLVVAARDHFAATPQPGERVVLALPDSWHFTSWTEGKQVYIAAAMIPADHLAALVKAL
jgi:hypothetical protein